jgi:hypothetical protein
MYPITNVAGVAIAWKFFIIGHMVFSTIATKYKIIFGVALIVVLASIPSIYFYRQYQAMQLRVNNPKEAAKQDALKTVAAVGKLLLLPTDEEPTIGELTDVTKLQNQPFFATAQNGDKLLYYNNSKQVILYRPSINKIINIGPANISTASATVAPTPASTAVPTKHPTPSVTSVKTTPAQE